MSGVCDLLETARAELAECETKMAYLRGRVSALEEAAKLETVIRPKRPPVAQQRAAPASEQTAASGIGSGSIVEHIVEIFRERGGVLKAAEISDLVEKRGVSTHSKRGMLPNIFSALSRRSDLFEKVDRGNYRLIEQKGDHETETIAGAQATGAA